MSVLAYLRKALVHSTIKKDPVLSNINTTLVPMEQVLHYSFYEAAQKGGINEMQMRTPHGVNILHHWIQVADGVRSKLVAPSSEISSEWNAYLVHLQPKARVSLHNHTKQAETVWTVEGTVYWNSHDKTTCNGGRPIKFKPGEDHSCIANTEALLLCRFDPVLAIRLSGTTVVS